MLTVSWLHILSRNHYSPQVLFRQIFPKFPPKIANMLKRVKFSRIKVRIGTHGQYVCVVVVVVVVL